ncbi:hypothetical protein QBC46DRAFT_5262 [Diplogelasinospora grovesii]|uniref:Uncharacterized protein n=1 Tax=Diplogelasinospora grovesii TaxID=303347 RepID=A0AAN6SAU3_9PEZI|nr:hypothetical protein QBC46DRAFT_5262 [Diplogelasinospora grovesii]
MSSATPALPFRSNEDWSYLGHHYHRATTTTGADQIGLLTTNTNAIPRGGGVDTDAESTSTMGYHAYDYAESENYTTDPRAGPSQTLRSIAASSRSTDASSVFSRRPAGRRGNDDRSSVGTSSAPPRQAPHRSFVQQFAHQFVPPTAPALTIAGPSATAAVPTATGSFVLWCEFCALQNCNATFRGDDEESWIAHHEWHVGDRYPKELMCWFCDHIPFVARHNNERRDNFRLRMQHIRTHIFYDYQTRDDMRPDFHMIEHLHKNRLIDDGLYRHAMRYDELPPELRLPGLAEANANLGAPVISGRLTHQERREYHDLEREEKRQRREQRNKDRKGKRPDTRKW